MGHHGPRDAILANNSSIKPSQMRCASKELLLYTVWRTVKNRLDIFSFAVIDLFQSTTQLCIRHF